MDVLLKPRWLALHAFTAFVVVSCAGLAWWQIVRADAGNGRSFGYAMQWPAIGVFGLGVWLWLCRDGIRVARGGVPGGRELTGARTVVPGAAPRSPVTIVDPAEEPELAAYNDMLARLAEKADREESRGQ